MKNELRSWNLVTKLEVQCYDRWWRPKLKSRFFRDFQVENRLFAYHVAFRHVLEQPRSPYRASSFIATHTAAILWCSLVCSWTSATPVKISASKLNSSSLWSDFRLHIYHSVARCVHWRIGAFLIVKRHSRNHAKHACALKFAQEMWFSLL